mmetsp:Transcript_32357/g.37359  ORF Transcript_32357/g.37359 Transcript_32357/m.37359 type:complete len:89 (-) Transcript_32357:182-448(-)
MIRFQEQGEKKKKEHAKTLKSKFFIFVYKGVNPTNSNDENCFIVVHIHSLLFKGKKCFHSLFISMRYFYQAPQGKAEGVVNLTLEMLE